MDPAWSLLAPRLVTDARGRRSAGGWRTARGRWRRTAWSRRSCAAPSPRRSRRWALVELGPPARGTVSFLGAGSPTKIDYRKKGTLILTSPLEDLGKAGNQGLWAEK